MKAISYKVKVTEGSLAMSHNFFETIKEIFIPELKIAFNEKGFIFKTEEPRAKGKKINISEDVSKQLEMCTRYKDKAEKIAKSIFDKTYEEKKILELELDIETIARISLLAHEKYMTFNEYLEELFEKMVDDFEKNPKKFMKEMKNAN